MPGLSRIVPSANVVSNLAIAGKKITEGNGGFKWDTSAVHGELSNVMSDYQTLDINRAGLNMTLGSIKHDTRDDFMIFYRLDEAGKWMDGFDSEDPTNQTSSPGDGADIMWKAWGSLAMGRLQQRALVIEKTSFFPYFPTWVCLKIGLPKM